MTAVFAGSVIVGEGLELLFIKAMCIIDYIYIYHIYIIFYHAFIMRAMYIGVRCWLLLFLWVFIMECIDIFC